MVVVLGVVAAAVAVVGGVDVEEERACLTHWTTSVVGSFNWSTRASMDEGVDICYGFAIMYVMKSKIAP